LDPAYPADRLHYILDDALIAVLITQSGLRERLPHRSWRTLALDGEESEQIAQQEEKNLRVRIHPANLAYVIYTSGSTGRPKGTMVQHDSLVNVLQSLAKILGFTKRDIFVATTTLSFDIAALELFLPLVVGGEVVVGSWDASSLKQLAGRTRRGNAIFLQATPSLWKILLEQSSASFPRNLKILCGGERLERTTAESFLHVSNDVWNLYGPTETTIWSAQYKVFDTAQARVPIGEPIANTRIYILDGDLKPVTVGEEGEIFIAGVGVARGYLNRPELTSERFLPDPFGGTPGERMYRTGDIGRWCDSEDLEFIGRIDNQVKLFGKRIEPGEIEAALREHSAVRDAAAVVWHYENGGEGLVAYVVSRREPAPSLTDLRVHLRKRIPEYMVPSAIMFLDHLPLTPNGKISTRDLPRPTFEPESDPYVAPRDAVEEVLCGIWRQVLAPRRSQSGLKGRIGVHDNFFELGADSFLCMEAVLWAEQAGIHLSPGQMFQHQTVAELASAGRLTGKIKHRSLSSILVPLRKQGSRTPLFFVHAAGGGTDFLWPLMRRLHAEQPVYAIRSGGHGISSYAPQIETMAAKYLKHLKNVQPRGPYCLASYSLGGHISFLMALFLSREGEQVALLAQIDCGPELPVDSAQQEHQLLMELCKEYGCDESLADQLLLVRPERRVKCLLEKIRLRAESRTYQQIRRILPVRYAHEKAVQRHLTKLFDNPAAYQYPGRITLFRTREGNAEKLSAPTATDVDVSLGWSAFSSQSVDVRWISGTHASCIAEPHVASVAEELTVCMSNVNTQVKAFGMHIS
jgi:amino acid adenylation domain-containing protein